jgi:hypothetical protein
VEQAFDILRFGELDRPRTQAEEAACQQVPGVVQLVIVGNLERYSSQAWNDRQHR